MAMNQLEKKKHHESMMVLVVALMVILVAGVLVFITGLHLRDRPVMGDASPAHYYSQPITILTQSAPADNGRAAYVKMTFIVSFNQRRHLQASGSNDAQIRSLISSELNRYTPEDLLEPSVLNQMQSSIQMVLAEELGLESNGVYLDRITVQ